MPPQALRAFACFAGGGIGLFLRTSRQRGGRPCARAASAVAQPGLTLHLYDHCPFCVKAELALGWLGIPYKRRVYGYGQGADPDTCDGTGYGPSEGPVVLTGRKMLPVLEGADVPAPVGMRGLPESMEICSYASTRGVGSIAPATGRADVSGWVAHFRPVGKQLTRPRIVKMPVQDWKNPRDAAYARWKHSKGGFDYSAAEAATSELQGEMAGILRELVPMLRGKTADGIPCLNAWGFSMDDIEVLPLLRNLTCVADLDWPTEVRAYVELACAKAGVALYTAHAC